MCHDYSSQVSPDRASQEYWAAYDDLAARKDNFADYSQQLLALSQTIADTKPEASLAPGKGPATVNVPSGGAYAKVQWPSLVNSLRGKALEECVSFVTFTESHCSSVADGWLVLPRPLSTSGQVEQLVSLQTSNLHTSESDKERDAGVLFSELLSQSDVDLELLSLSIKNAEIIPPEYRAVSWQLLFGLLSPNSQEWKSTLLSKREAYYELVLAHFVPSRAQGTPRGTLDYLIRMDVSRTHPQGFSHLFANPKVTASLHRVLFTWALSHPTIEYFQGLNELAVPLYLVYLTSALGPLSDYHDEYATNRHIKPHLDVYLPAVEADVYWSLHALLTSIADHYTFSQGGLFAEPMVAKLDSLVERTHPELHAHLRDVLDIPFIQFSFRWLLCLMTRELAPRNAILLWDQCLAEQSDGFTVFLLYICAAFLGLLAPLLLEVEEMGRAMYILQSPPTAYWDDSNLQHLVSLARQYYKQCPPML